MKARTRHATTALLGQAIMGGGMTMIYTFDVLNGFLVCSDSSNWAYAQPGSPYWERSLRDPVGTAHSMARDADCTNGQRDREACIGRNARLSAYYASLAKTRSRMAP